MMNYLLENPWSVIIAFLIILCIAGIARMAYETNQEDQDSAYYESFDKKKESASQKTTSSFSLADDTASPLDFKPLDRVRMFLFVKFGVDTSEISAGSFEDGCWALYGHSLDFNKPRIPFNELKAEDFLDGVHSIVVLSDRGDFADVFTSVGHFSVTGYSRGFNENLYHNQREAVTRLLDMVRAHLKRNELLGAVREDLTLGHVNPFVDVSEVSVHEVSETSDVIEESVLKEGGAVGVAAEEAIPEDPNLGSAEDGVFTPMTQDGEPVLGHSISVSENILLAHMKKHLGAKVFKQVMSKEVSMILKDLYKELTTREKGKVQLNHGQAKEVAGVLADILLEKPESLKTLIALGKRRNSAAKKASKSRSSSKKGKK